MSKALIPLYLAFDRLRAASLHPDDSVQLIEQAASILT